MGVEKARMPQNPINQKCTALLAGVLDCTNPTFFLLSLKEELLIAVVLSLAFSNAHLNFLAQSKTTS
ncbi:MAG: hypothetical protein U0Z26_04460 [Anaerolineales bacterium]